MQKSPTAEAIGLSNQLQGQIAKNLVLLAVTHVILADDVVDVGIVDQAAMLLMEEHEQRRSDTLNVGQVDVDEHEADEHEHHEVVDDAHAHKIGRAHV